MIKNVMICLFVVATPFVFGAIYCAGYPQETKKVALPESQEITGKCILVSDADTITVSRDTGIEVKIRLAEIDCPESDQPFGDIAHDVTAALVLGQEIQVNITGKDRYNRLIGTVYCGHELSVNEILLRCGLAWHYKQYSKNEYFAQLQDEAQKYNKGLWAYQPIEPAVHRKQKKR
jgi:endonuclease YncB( thermonuclease family)